MVKVKAKRADKPRVVKTWRLKSNVVRKIKKMAQTGACSESELVEKAVDFLDLWLESHPHVGNVVRG